ncbi:MAG: SH3 domain-containing protein [Candidatus Xenobiia bacterium LiM19]
MRKRYTGLRIAFTVAIAVLLLHSAYADNSLPEPDGKGDYTTFNHLCWRVVDRDPEGLNGRKLTAAVDAFGQVDITTMPVIITFPGDSILLVRSGCVDRKGNTWLNVVLGAENRYCLVRANNKYVIPVKTPEGVQCVKISQVRDSDGFTHLRSGKGTEAVSIEKVKSASDVVVLSSLGEWWKVMSLSGNTGYIHRSRLGSASGHRDGYAVAMVNDPDGYTNLRQGPSKDASVISKIPNKCMVLLAEPGEWSSVITADRNEQRGYMKSTLLEWIIITRTGRQ